ADGRLPIERHAANGAGGHRPERVGDEDRHGADQGHGKSKNEDASRGLSGLTAKPGQYEAGDGPHAGAAVSRPSSSTTARSERPATSMSCVAVTRVRPSSSLIASMRSSTRSPVAESS